MTVIFLTVLRTLAAAKPLVLGYVAIALCPVAVEPRRSTEMVSSSSLAESTMDQTPVPRVWPGRCDSIRRRERQWTVLGASSAPSSSASAAKEFVDRSELDRSAAVEQREEPSAMGVMADTAVSMARIAARSAPAHTREGHTLAVGTADL